MFIPSRPVQVFVGLLIFGFNFGFSFQAFSLSLRDRENLETLKEWYPVRSCSTDRELAQCFKWSQRDCETKAKKSVEVCLIRNDRELKKDDTGDLDQWEEKIILCAFKDLKSKNAKISIDSALCQAAGRDQ